MGEWAGQIWTGISSAAVVLLVIGTFGQFLLKHMLDRNLADQQARLRLSGDTEVERVRTELSREIESHKVRLKKSEFLFEKEFEAASAFVVLANDYAPKHSFPGMDWDEACDQMADRFNRTERELERFMATHGAILLADDRAALQEAIAIAGQGKFDVVEFAEPMMTGYSAGIRAEAAKLFKQLEELETRLVGRVRDQSSS